MRDIVRPAWLHGRMDEGMNKRTKGMNERTNERVTERTNEQTNEQTSD